MYMYMKKTIMKEKREEEEKKKKFIFKAIALITVRHYPFNGFRVSIME